MKPKYSCIYDFCSYKGYSTSLVKYQFPRFYLSLFKTVDGFDRKVMSISFVSVSKSMDDFFEYLQEVVE